MSKEDLLKDLDKEKQDFLQFLLDIAYSNGYSDGVIKTKLSEC